MWSISKSQQKINDQIQLISEKSKSVLWRKQVDHSHLVIGPLLVLLLLRQHHPQGEEAHYDPVTEVTKHYSKQEGECDDGVGS